jgi:hypothetical protein
MSTSAGEHTGMVTSVKHLISRAAAQQCVGSIQTFQSKLRQLSREGPKGEQWSAVHTPVESSVGSTRPRYANLVLSGVVWPNCIDDRRSWSSGRTTTGAREPQRTSGAASFRSVSKKATSGHKRRENRLRRRYHADS